MLSEGEHLSLFRRQLPGGIHREIPDLALLASERQEKYAEHSADGKLMDLRERGLS
jgi:hypothetical protein